MSNNSFGDRMKSYEAIERLSISVQYDVRRLVARIFEEYCPLPHSLNLGMNEDGEVQLVLFGAGGRQVDIWVGEGAPGQMTVVTSDGTDLSERTMGIEDYRRVAAWLAGGADSL